MTRSLFCLFLFCQILFSSALFAGELAPNQALDSNLKAKSAIAKNVACPTYLQELNKSLTSKVELLKVCSSNLNLPDEANDPMFVNRGISDHLTFLKTSQTAQPEACALEFSAACPGGHGNNCKGQSDLAIQKVSGFYVLQGKIHSESESLQDEMNYSEQLLELGKVKFTKSSCQSSYSDIQKTCESKTCQIASDELKKVTDDIGKVMKNLKDYETQLKDLELYERQSRLGHELGGEKSGEIRALKAQIATLKAQYPLTQSKAFSKIFKLNDPNTYQPALLAQIQANLPELSKRKADLEAAAQCTLGERCQLSSIQSVISDLPSIKLSEFFQSPEKNIAGVVAKQKLNDFQCRVEQRKLNKEMNSLIASSAVNLGLTGLTFGISGVTVLARAGLMLAEAETAGATIRVGAQIAGAAITVGTDVYNLQDGAMSALAECKKTYLQKSTIEKSQTACHAAQFSKAYSDWQSCSTSVIVAGLGVLPFAQGLKAFKGSANGVATAAEHAAIATEHSATTAVTSPRARLIAPIDNTGGELPAMRRSEVLSSMTVQRPGGRTFEEISLRNKKPVGQDSPDTVRFGNRYPNFSKKMGFEFSRTGRTRPADSKTFNSLIEEENKNLSAEERIPARFYDEWTENGVPKDEFAKRWAEGDGLPINQRNAKEHFHDTGVHAIPIVNLTAETVDRSQHNFRVILDLLEKPEFESATEFKKAVTLRLDNALETQPISANNVLIDLLDRKQQPNHFSFTPNEIQYMNHINSIVLPRRLIDDLATHLNPEQARLFNVALAQLKPGFTETEAIQQVDIIRRRLERSP